MHVKTSKKLMLAAAVVIMLNLNSCGKYDDGPAFSLKTKTSRLVGEWEIVEINGVNQTSNTSFEFDDDGDFSVTSSYSYDGYNYNYSSKGEWEWEDGKETIEVQMDGSTTKDEWEILRLTKDELWFEDDNNNEYQCEKD